MLKVLSFPTLSYEPIAAFRFAFAWFFCHTEPTAFDASNFIGPTMFARQPMTLIILSFIIIVMSHSYAM